MKLKEKEAEMNMYLNAKKPQHIDFTDKIEEEEKIGNNMDRLIADALASRERELQQLSNNVDLNKAKEWLGNNDQNKTQPHKDSSNTVNPFLIHQNRGLEKEFTTDHEKKNVRFNNKDDLDLNNKLQINKLDNIPDFSKSAKAIIRVRVQYKGSGDYQFVMTLQFGSVKKSPYNIAPIKKSSSSNIDTNALQKDSILIAFK